MNIKTITPAVISRAKGRSSKLIIRLSVKTINGYKAIARKGKSAQEVFISTDLSKFLIITSFVLLIFITFAVIYISYISWKDKKRLKK